MSSWTCPYCGNAQATQTWCESCRRNPSSARRVCPACKRMTPKDEKLCCHCAHKFTSELGWKIPLAIAIFIAGIVVTALLQTIR